MKTEIGNIFWIVEMKALVNNMFYILSKNQMRLMLNFITILILFLSCNSAESKRTQIQEKISYQPQDKEKLEHALNVLSNETYSSMEVMTMKVGTFFLETPYAEKTLEIEPEQLVINMREMDCTTFAENCLAIARTLKGRNPGFEQFTKELKNIRYRNGEINDYPSRLHYFSDWIYNNSQKKLVADVSKEIAETPYPLNINFMSTHPESYKQLTDNSAYISEIARQEKEISGREMYYIPEDKIVEFENQLTDGDIIGITTNVKGLDIQHVAILIHRAGRIHLLHASSSAKKVVISDETLEDYLLNSNSATGIMVVRPH